MIEIKQEDNGKKGRFAIYEDGKFAGEMTYTWAGGEKFIIDHTEVDPEFSGKGFGEKLLLKTVEHARENNLKIIPLCPFANRMLHKNVELQDVLFDKRGLG
ncbi:MAG TPA: GNAT family N-acetyltransferase [Flavobacteriaceae bacterium]|nr:GNAT family N-acetyltransferase [Flavobacteriaceae bacterium]